MQALLTKLGPAISGIALQILTTFLSLFGQALGTLVTDEEVIFANAGELIVTRVKAGDSWEVAFTAAMNQFYGAQATEVTKFETAILEAWAKFVAQIASIL